MPDEDQPAAKATKKTAEEDQFTKASAIAASRGIAGVSPHVMAGALHELGDDDPVTRQEAADAVAKLREPTKEA
jgi:hypothetical protein